MSNYKILGMISGSSLDGIDIAHCTFTFNKSSSGKKQLIDWTLDETQTIPFESAWAERLKSAVKANALELLQLDREFGALLGKEASTFIIQNKLHPDYIASHGHTVHHYPEQGFTYQIGAGATLSENSGISVINGFRDQDVAAGGQGAPIAPAADAWLFDSSYTFFLNLGGIANISCRANQHFLAFDISGCNQILNALANQLGLDYDKNGNLAASGKMIQPLFELANKNPFFVQSYPKSLDNLWVETHQSLLFKQFDAPLTDKLYTAVQLIAFQVANSIKRLISEENLNLSTYKLLVTGGGALNNFLIQCLQEHCTPLNVFIEVPSKRIVEFKEAAMIALMGALRLEMIPNVMASVTGAKADTINGAIFAV